MSNRRRVVSWIFSVAAIVAAGLLGGWILGRGAPGTDGDTQPQDGSTIASDSPAHTNRLAKESSPYLQLHQHNPVDWYPWGPEAFEKAKAEEKPIFLSIGYSSCYWCHVMERESFSDPEIARILNEHFVSIKVDREELPDVDEIYMTAVQAMRGQGGWPLTVFLTPDRKPFFGGTYFPPTDQGERAGLTTVLEWVIEKWNERREETLAFADRFASAVQRESSLRRLSFQKLDRQVVGQGVSEIASLFDPEYGGFGYQIDRPHRPKFPQPPKLELLLYQARQTRDRKVLAMLTRTLDFLSRGGIWDHIAGGFHRYSTDRFWRVPHFEKMLYDNAQLARVYLEAFELTHNEDYRHQAAQIFAFVNRELTSPEGGFYSALDAESEHEEGKYYVWTGPEIQELLTPEEFNLFAVVYGLKGPPSFEGERYVLQRFESMATLAEVAQVTPEELDRLLAPMRQKLLDARNKRPRPLLDYKILTDWNGLMIAALADGYRLLGNDAYRRSAEAATGVMFDKLRTSSGRLLHVYAAGQAKQPAYLEDYVFLSQGLLALHQATDQPEWLDGARSLADAMIALFWDEAGGGFFRTAADQDIVLARLKPSDDSVLPSGNGAAVRVLVALAQRTGASRYAELAAQTLAAFSSDLTSAPSSHPTMVRGLSEYLDAGFPAELLATPFRSEASVVQAQALLSLDRLLPGREFQIAVTLDIASDWHIYANPPLVPGLLPATLELSSDLSLDEVKVQYPRPRQFQNPGSDEVIAVYAGRALIAVAAKLDEQASPGKSEIRLGLRYQACNRERCLAPRTIQITLPVEIAAANESVHELFPDLFQTPDSAADPAPLKED